MSFFHHIHGNYILGNEVYIGSGVFLQNDLPENRRYFYGFLTMLRSINSVNETKYELYLSPVPIDSNQPLSTYFDESVREQLGYTNEQFNNQTNLVTQTFIINRTPAVNSNVNENWSYSITPTNLVDTPDNYLTVSSVRPVDTVAKVSTYYNGIPNRKSYIISPSNNGQVTTNNLLYGTDYDIRAINGDSDSYFPIDTNEGNDSWVIQRLSLNEDELLVIDSSTNRLAQTFNGLLSINRNIQEGSLIRTKPIFTLIPASNTPLYNINTGCSTPLSNFNIRQFYAESFQNTSTITCNNFDLQPCEVTTDSNLCSVMNSTELGTQCGGNTFGVCEVLNDGCQWNFDDEQFECNEEIPPTPTPDNLSGIVIVIIVISLLALILLSLGLITYFNRS